MQWCVAPPNIRMIDLNCLWYQLITTTPSASLSLRYSARSALILVQRRGGTRLVGGRWYWYSSSSTRSSQHQTVRSVRTSGLSPSEMRSSTSDWVIPVLAAVT